MTVMTQKWKFSFYYYLLPESSVLISARILFLISILFECPLMPIGSSNESPQSQLIF